MCGIIGFAGNPHSAHESYQALLLMQHRGQDAAGILSYSSNKEQFFLHKNQGLTSDVFDESILKTLHGEFAIGHNRYTTVGQNHYQDTQPLVTNYPFGIGLVHNGNLTNYAELVQYLKKDKNRYIFSNNDAEIMLNLISDQLAQVVKESGENPFHFGMLVQAVESLYSKAQGAYSAVGMIAQQGVFAFRDPKGIRPLQIGKRTELTDNGEKKTSYCFASENNVFNFLGYETLPEIRPGELVFVDLQGNLFRQQIIKEKKKFPCMFEWVYFSNPDAEFESRNIYHIRTRLGEELAKQIQVSLNLNEIEPDCVASVPETSRIASQTISDRLQLPHKELLIKNRYIQRSFILPHQKERETAVDLKLMPIPSEVRGKKILLIDDSVVRGTTSKRIIKSLRAAGADKIYLALTCPPIQYACYYGVDFPDSEQLVAYNKDNQTIAQEIGADRLIYLSIDGLKKAIDLPDLCMGCIDQFYPAGVIDHSQGKSRRGHRSHEETPAQY